MNTKRRPKYMMPNEKKTEKRKEKEE